MIDEILGADCIVRFLVDDFDVEEVRAADEVKDLLERLRTEGFHRLMKSWPGSIAGPLSAEAIDDPHGLTPKRGTEMLMLVAHLTRQDYRCRR